MEAVGGHSDNEPGSHEKKDSFPKARVSHRTEPSAMIGKKHTYLPSYSTFASYLSENLLHEMFSNHFCAFLWRTPSNEYYSFCVLGHLVMSIILFCCSCIFSPITSTLVSHYIWKYVAWNVFEPFLTHRRPFDLTSNTLFGLCPVPTYFSAFSVSSFSSFLNDLASKRSKSRSKLSINDASSTSSSSSPPKSGTDDPSYKCYWLMQWLWRRLNR